ncbi:histidinol phosphate phosphatase H [Coniochaeta ligniaria NRRL 30616]|uniref:Histidinol-phosphatase n=1 Tax=Coniochaeta ligniaria NRRL 30616 TaxID=1408157 RepID=A0A1J7IM06_9PEZI|nr:histidinol phosphate phosphatase H [Coniochaeta ligniaria NRRL 30616]
MAFTMHSHSGQFCPGHAKDQLEDIIKHAISIGYKTMGLTEHMPRYSPADLYPEELDDPEALSCLPPRHAAFLSEATRLRQLYASQLHILIGFEAEWIRASDLPHVRALAADPVVDYFIGSVHHAAGIPIDYDAAYYGKAVAACGGSEEGLYASYYDSQMEMLTALRPKVVGHFDLIRLLSAEPGRKLRGWEGGRVWEKVRRNLEFVAGYGGLLECNTSALRKGLEEPYPSREIAEEWVRLGGRFTMSDDSHGIAQVATNYGRGLGFLESIGVEEVWTFERKGGDGKEEVVEKRVSLREFRSSLGLEIV